jgi:hypothetical protein
VRWHDFAAACPEIASVAEDRFRADELVLLGTIRADGSPRISPCEVDFAEGELLLGMMWQSKKALDLARDPRWVVHSVPSDKTNQGGDVKVYGRAAAVADPDLRSAYREAIQARIDWAPDEPEYHLFSLDVERAAYIVFGDQRRLLTWDAERGLRHLPVPD